MLYKSKLNCYKNMFYVSGLSDSALRGSCVQNSIEIRSVVLQKVLQYNVRIGKEKILLLRTILKLSNESAKFGKCITWLLVQMTSAMMTWETTVLSVIQLLRCTASSCRELFAGVRSLTTNLNEICSHSNC